MSLITEASLSDFSFKWCVVRRAFELSSMPGGTNYGADKALRFVQLEDILSWEQYHRRDVHLEGIGILQALLHGGAVLPRIRRGSLCAASRRLLWWFTADAALKPLLSKS